MRITHQARGPQARLTLREVSDELFRDENLLTEEDVNDDHRSDRAVHGLGRVLDGAQSTANEQEHRHHDGGPQKERSATDPVHEQK